MSGYLLCDKRKEMESEEVNNIFRIAIHWNSIISWLAEQLSVSQELSSIELDTKKHFQNSFSSKFNQERHITKVQNIFTAFIACICW
jgi:hypothetical protein